MVDLRRLSEEIRRLYGIVDELESVCCEHGRHFTLDGHLLGSIGEVYAAERYGLRLLTSSAKRHDAVTEDGRLVQIKVTQSRAKKKTVPLSHEPDYLLVLVVDESGQFEEVYNGLVDLMAHFCRTQKEIFGFPGGPLHDPCTIVWLIAPDVTLTFSPPSTAPSFLLCAVP